MKLPKNKLVIVKWRDSSAESSWTIHPERHTLSVCTTVGYVVRKKRDRVVIGASLDDTGAVSQRMAIPRSVIKDVRKLNIGKRP